MKQMKAVFRELQKQLTNTPSFLLQKYPLPSLTHPESVSISKQIEQALKQSPKFIFLLGPSGAGKTTLISHFLKQHPKLKYKYRSFVRVNNLDFAFYHLTNYFSRTALIFLSALFFVLLISYFPPLAAFPIAFTLSPLFMKNSSHLAYLIHESCRNICFGKQKLMVIEDLERSPLSSKEQWAFLANLWQYHYTYLIGFGYPSDFPDTKIEIFDHILKLGGTIIEIPLSEQANFQLIYKLDPDFPFLSPIEEIAQEKGWLSLFTFRELIIIKQQVDLRCYSQPSREKRKNPIFVKQLEFIKICLDFLIRKIKLDNKEITFSEKTMQLICLNEAALSVEQLHYITSFTRAVIPEFKLTLFDKKEENKAQELVASWKK